MAYQRKRPPLDPCPVEHVLAMVAGKWKARVLYLLALDDLGFAELRHGVGGVKQQVLSSLLRQLEADGIVSRGARDPRSGSRYALTARGRELVGLLVPVAAFGNRLLAAQGLAWPQPLPALPARVQDTAAAAPPLTARRTRPSSPQSHTP